jgi:ketosteroid isomerase-like protein
MQQSAAVLTGATYQPPTQSQISEAADWVSRFAERWKKPDLEALRDLMQPDTQNLIPPMTVPADREGVIAHFRQALERLPDLNLTVLRWAPVADAVMVEWEAAATVAGKPIRWRGVDRVCLRDGRTYEGQVYWDTRALAQTIAEAAETQGS